MISRMATPPTINIISEILCIIRILSFSYSRVLLIIFSVLLAGLYSIVLYARTQQSRFFSNIILCKTVTANELLVFYSHIF